MTDAYGRLLRRLRTANKETQAGLGSSIGKSHSAVAHLEAGRRRPRSREEVIATARALGASAAETDDLLLAAGWACESEMPGHEEQDEARLELETKLQRTQFFWKSALLFVQEGRSSEEDMKCLLTKICRVYDPSDHLATRAAIFLPSESGLELRIAHQVGLNPSRVSDIRFRLTFEDQGDKTSAGVAGLTYITGKAQHVRNVQEDPRFVHHATPSMPAVCRSLLAAPLLYGDGPLGVLCIDSRRSIFGEIDLRILECLARGVASLLHRRAD